MIAVAIIVGYALVTGLVFSMFVSKEPVTDLPGLAEVFLLFVCAILWPLTVLAIGVGRMIRSDDY